MSLYDCFWIRLATPPPYHYHYHFVFIVVTISNFLCCAYNSVEKSIKKMIQKKIIKAGQQNRTIRFCT